MATEQTFKVLFEGGLSTSGILQYYDFSRSAYGLARLLNTVEHFRRTGQILKKVSAKTYVDLYIRAPERGSFPIDVIIPALPSAVQFFSSVSIEVLVAYVANVFSSWTAQEKDDLVKIAQAHLEIERERTAQSAQETERLQAVQKIVEDQNITIRDAIGTISELAKNNKVVSRAELDQERIADVLRRTEGVARREEILEPHQEELAKIGEEKLLKLAARVRPQIEEIGKPVGRSASSVSFIINNNRAFIDYTESDLDMIRSRYIEEVDVQALLRIVAFDRDGGYGKSDIIDLSLTKVPFQLPVARRAVIREKIIEAMKLEAINARVRLIRDVSNAITSFLLLDIDGEAFA